MHVNCFPALTFVVLLAFVFLTNKGFYVNYFLLGRTLLRISVDRDVLLLWHCALTLSLVRARGRHAILYRGRQRLAELRRCSLDYLLGDGLLHEVDLTLPDQLHEAIGERDHRFLRRPVQQLFYSSCLSTARQTGSLLHAREHQERIALRGEVEEAAERRLQQELGVRLDLH